MSELTMKDITAMNKRAQRNRRIAQLLSALLDIAVSITVGVCFGIWQASSEAAVVAALLTLIWLSKK